MEPSKGFGGFWRASSALGSLPRAFEGLQRPSSAFERAASTYQGIQKGFQGFPKGSQWSCPRAPEASRELQMSSEASQGLFEGLKGLHLLFRELPTLAKTSKGLPMLSKNHNYLLLEKQHLRVLLPRMYSQLETSCYSNGITSLDTNVDLMSIVHRKV